MTTVLAKASNDIYSLVDRMTKANLYLDNVEEKLNFDGKNLEQICKDHAKNVFQASKWMNEMKALEEFLEMKVKDIESKHWKKYNENHGRSLTTRDIQAYIAGEPDYVTMRELQLEVVYVKAQVQSIHEALKDMGWQIKYVTDLRINELQETVV